MSSSPAANPAENQQPWVTYGLLVLCAIAWMYSNSLERDVLSSADAAVEKAAAYWTERPYLEPADIIVKKLTTEAIESRRAEFRRGRPGKSSIGVPKAVQSHYQEILDGLTAEALEPLSQLPRYRMGVRISKPSGVAYFAHAFLHGGWLHLIGNGILLLILGCYIERVWGHALFGVFALTFSLAAATAFRIGNPELNASLIGTSGMIAGLLAAFTLRFASRWTEASYCSVIIGGLCWLTLPAGFGWDGSVVPGPTVSGEMAGAANASFWAVAGGFGCGIVIASMMMLGKIEAILFNNDPTTAKKPSVDPDLEIALDAHANGRSEEAFELISDLLDRKPEHRAALLAMWEVALDQRLICCRSLARSYVPRLARRRRARTPDSHRADAARSRSARRSAHCTQEGSGNFSRNRIARNCDARGASLPVAGSGLHRSRGLARSELSGPPLQGSTKSRDTSGGALPGSAGVALGKRTARRCGRRCAFRLLLRGFGFGFSR